MKRIAPCVVVLVLVSSPAFGQDRSMVGTWSVDDAKTTIPATGPTRGGVPSRPRTPEDLRLKLTADQVIFEVIANDGAVALKTVYRSSGPPTWVTGPKPGWALAQWRGKRLFIDVTDADTNQNVERTTLYMDGDELVRETQPAVESPIKYYYRRRQ